MDANTAPAPKPATIKVFVMRFTEAEAQQALNIFEWATRNGGMPIAKECLPIAQKFMDAAVKAAEAENAAKAATKPEEPTKN